MLWRSPMTTRDESIDIAVNDQRIAGTLVTPDTLIPGVLFVHGWGGSQEKYLERARQIAALGCVCLTFNLRGHGDTEPQHETVTREDNLRDLMAAYDVLARQPIVDRASIAAVGSSYGGYLAAILTSLRPVRWLALRVPALYRDEDWSLPKQQLKKYGLAAYRRLAISPYENRALGACAGFRGTDRRVGARRHHPASGDRQLHGGVRAGAFAHLPGDRRRRPRLVGRALAAGVHDAAGHLGDRDGAGRPRGRRRSRNFGAPESEGANGSESQLRLAGAREPGVVQRSERGEQNSALQMHGRPKGPQ